MLRWTFSKSSTTGSVMPERLAGLAFAFLLVFSCHFHRVNAFSFVF